MKYLWENIRELHFPLDRRRDILLLLDYDGTIVPIKPTPQQVKLPEKTKILLQKLKEKLQGKIGIMSGRSLSEIKKQVGIRNLIYAGNHGMEWEIEGKKHTIAKIKKISSILTKVKKSLRLLEEKFRGVFIEDKKFTLTVHYRLLGKKYAFSFHRYIKYLLDSYLKTGSITLMKGKKVYEIMLPLNWNKGDFIKLLIERNFLKQHKPLLIIYIGDDRTDEEAFLKLTDIITVKVGKGKSSARYYVNNHYEVIKFLELLISDGFDGGEVGGLSSRKNSKNYSYY